MQEGWPHKQQGNRNQAGQTEE